MDNYALTLITNLENRLTALHKENETIKTKHNIIAERLYQREAEFHQRIAKLEEAVRLIHPDANLSPDCSKKDYESLKVQIDNLQPEIDRIKKGLDSCAPKTSCANCTVDVGKAIHVNTDGECIECGKIITPKLADHQPERTLLDKYEGLFNGFVPKVHPSIIKDLAKIAEEHYRQKLEEFAKEFYYRENAPFYINGLRSKLFNG